MTWAVGTHREGAAAFHARDPGAAPERSVWVCEPTDRALVLGSAQKGSDADLEACRRAGVEVVRRRSGGGAVLVEPGGLLWVDVVLPAGDPLWEVDVGKAFLWLGDTWQRALAEVGVAATVHAGALLSTRWSRLVCFGGLGPGEVTTPGGVKLVGVSQRRTRAWARFQCAALLRWEPDALLALLALGERERREASADLLGVAGGIGADVADLLGAFLGQLP